MSDPAQHRFVDQKARPLLPAGQAWYERIVDDQLPLVRQVASILDQVNAGLNFDSIGDYLSGVSGGSSMFVWSFKAADVTIQGPPLWGYDGTTLKPSRDQPAITDVSRARAYLTATGEVVETETGDVDSLPSEIVLSEQTVWFVPAPPDHKPCALISEIMTLFDGAAFLSSGRWLLFFVNPFELWPDGVVVSYGVRTKNSWKSSTLRADRLYTSGIEVAKYKRDSQNLKQFERALCEVAGLKILDRDGLVVRQETGNNMVIHWLDDGRSFTLPVYSPYLPGSVVEAGSGHVLQLRHQDLQGTDWWRSRPWGAIGLPVFAVRPGFYGFSFPDRECPVVFYEDGDAMRAKLVIDQDEEAETLFWDWQAAQERRMGVQTLATYVLSASDEVDQIVIDSEAVQPLLAADGSQIFDASGNTLYVAVSTDFQIRSALGTIASVFGPWLAVVETSLDANDPRAFRELVDFVNRERPAGVQVYCVGTGGSFEAPQFYDVYLDTGELVAMDSNTVLALPLGY